MSRVHWLPLLHRLGVNSGKSDPVVAAELSAELQRVIAPQSVAHARYRHNVASANPKVDYYAGENLFLMGAVTDSEFAARLGRTPEAVSAARRRRGEHKYEGPMPQKCPKWINWDAQDPNEDAKTQALRLGVKLWAVQRARQRRAQKAAL